MKNPFCWVLTACFVMFMSCRTSRFPICERMGNTKPSAIQGVSKTLYDVCAERNIRITPLSSNIAIFRGPVWQMKWLQRNYPVLICDFDQAGSNIGAATCANCLSHSETWIKIVQSKKPEMLMADGVLYCPICVPNQKCF